MALDSALESLANQVLAPLSGDVGEDLSQTSSTDLIEIRNQFTESSRDFSRLFEVGQEILSNQSKDLWAAWALVGGLLWSKKFEPDHAFATSCLVTGGLCEKYWDKLYPESLGLRNTLLTNINKWWNTYIVRGSDGADPELLRIGFEAIKRLDLVVRESVGGEDEKDTLRRFPMLANLNQVSKSLETLLKQSAPPEPKQDAQATPPPQAETASAEASPQQSAPATPVATQQKQQAPVKAAPPPDSLDVAYDKAISECSSGSKDDALKAFQQVLEHQAEFADKFRGQVMLGQLYLKAGFPTHAKRVLQNAHDQIKEIKLPMWDPKLCSRLWSTLIEAHLLLDKEGEKADNKLLSEVFAEICRIDPVTAAKVQPIRDK